jgi:hypothetical protein
VLDEDKNPLLWSTKSLLNIHRAGADALEWPRRGPCVPDRAALARRDTGAGLPLPRVLMVCVKLGDGWFRRLGLGLLTLSKAERTVAGERPGQLGR